MGEREPSWVIARGMQFPSRLNEDRHTHTESSPLAFCSEYLSENEGDALPQLVHRTRPQPWLRAAAQMCF